MATDNRLASGATTCKQGVAVVDLVGTENRAQVALWALKA